MASRRTPTRLPARLRPGPRRRAAPGYSLVEMLAVVLILGILAALVTYSANWIIARARLIAFQSNAQTFIDAAEIYYAREGQYPVSPAPGQLPPNWDRYVDADKWLAPTPLGGRWHIGGDPVGLGVLHDLAADEVADDSSEDEDVIRQSVLTDLQQYDETIDDGNLETGSFATAGAGFYRHIFGG